MRRTHYCLFMFRTSLRLMWIIALAGTAIGFERAAAAAAESSKTDSSSAFMLVGKVTWRGQPLEAAWVASDQGGATADKDGLFEFGPVHPGPIRLRVIHLPCDLAWFDVVAEKGDTVQVEPPCPMLLCREEGPAGPGCFSPNLAERERVGTTCPIHPRNHLEADTVSVDIGLTASNPSHMRARSEQFPNARSSWGGGCVIQTAIYTEVAFCPACRVAEDAWFTGRSR